MKTKYKCGEPILLDGLRYIFLGYSDSAMRWGWFADQHGNKHLRYLRH